ncbi:hypothetical protein [Clostridium magnum]|uniref:Putative transposase n=1 Tax=Clostridium magnum DSM 2767 TaxID=1121326 RepID=A0A162SR14_9CLOT|nr:hypothetical protein [Clostridium magnum]KZL91753.1 putative transposase [Clostridium magnum DSM 2767]SHJ03021.1 Probable transposase [Clostridium magnum DSM 2767]
MIKDPDNLEGKKIKEVRILPKHSARFFEIQYIYECTETQIDLDQTHALTIDLGVNNLSTYFTNKGNSFIPYYKNYHLFLIILMFSTK